jgi:hypothetical protein
LKKKIKDLIRNGTRDLPTYILECMQHSYVTHFQLDYLPIALSDIIGTSVELGFEALVHLYMQLSTSDVNNPTTRKIEVEDTKSWLGHCSCDMHK